MANEIYNDLSNLMYYVNDWLYIVPEWLDRSIVWIESSVAWLIPDGAPDWLVDFLEPIAPDLPHFYVQQNICEKAFDVGILILTLSIFLFFVFVWRRYFSESSRQKVAYGDYGAEKSEILSEDLVNVEKRVELIKSTCQNVSKKLQSCLQGQGTDGAGLDKRLKKIPEMQLANCMTETSASFGEQSILGNVLQVCGGIEKQLSNELLDHEMEVERKVINKQLEILENDVPSITKHKKHLQKLILDMDSARTRYHTAARHSVQPSVTAKVEVIKEEMDDASLKVEQCRDTLAAEMFTLISRESELAQHFYYLVKSKMDYHKKSLLILENCSKQIEEEIKNFHARPMYGMALEEHLNITDRQIALPIEACVCFLLDYGVNEEGLFRVAGGSSKVKKLTAAFDASLYGIIDMNDYTKDPHAVAGALKSYLRNLPNPLLTHELYSEWMQATRVSDVDARLQALWVILRKLPESYFNNLRYLIKFLNRLSTYHETTKMSIQNLALMIGPNLIWAPEDAGSGMMNMTMANAYSTIADHLISQADWFFPGDIEFNISLPMPKSPYEGGFVSSAEMDNYSSNGDLDSNAQSNHSSPQSGASPKMFRRNKKPAPPIPPIQRERPQPAERVSLVQDRSASVETRRTLERKKSTPSDVIPMPVPAARNHVERSHTTAGDRPLIPEKPSLEKRSSGELNKPTFAVDKTSTAIEKLSSALDTGSSDVHEVSWQEEQLPPPSPEKYSDDDSPAIRRRRQSPSPGDRFDYYRPDWYGSVDEESSVSNTKLNSRNLKPSPESDWSDVTQSSAEDLNHHSIPPSPERSKKKDSSEIEPGRTKPLEVGPRKESSSVLFIAPAEFEPVRSKLLEVGPHRETCTPVMTAFMDLEPSRTKPLEVDPRKESLTPVMKTPSKAERSITPERPAKPPRMSDSSTEQGSDKIYSTLPRRMKLSNESINSDASKEPVRPPRPEKPARPASFQAERPERPERPPNFLGAKALDGASKGIGVSEENLAKQESGIFASQDSLSFGPPSEKGEKIQSIRYKLVVGSKKETSPTESGTVFGGQEVPLHDVQLPRLQSDSPSAPRRPPRPQPPPPLKGRLGSSSEDTHL